jgi:flagellar protein FlbT
MSLKVELKPGERMIVGDCLITSGDQRARLFLDGQVPILREKDIISAAAADTPAKRIYFAVQLMYLDDDVEKVRARYFELVNDIVKAAPSTIGLVDNINNEILTGSLYKALKAAKLLIQYEQGLLNDAAAGRAGLPESGQADG